MILALWKRFQTKQELKHAVQGVVSPADPGLAPDVLQAQLEDADAKLVICCSATLSKVRRARELAARDIPVLVMDHVDDMNDDSRTVMLSDLIKV